MTLSYSYFSFLLNLHIFLRCQNRETSCRCRCLNRGPHVVGPQVVTHTTILTFFSLYFSSLVCRLIHPYRLSNNLRSDIRDISLNIQVEPVGAGFSLCPHYAPYRWVYKLSRCLTAGPSGRFRSVGFVPTLSKTIVLAVHFAVLGLAFFLFCLDFASRRRQLRTYCFRRCLQVCRATRSAAVSLQLYTFVGLACLARCHARSRPSARLWSLSPGFRPVVPSQTWSPLAITSEASLLLLLALDSTKLLLLLNPVLRHWCPIRPLQLLDGLQALASLPN